MKDITILIPVHKYGKETRQLLREAINSCKTKNKDLALKVAIVGPETALNLIKKDFSADKYTGIEYIINSGDTDFCSQVNVGVENAGEYFSILEFDDKFSDTWFDNLKKYSDYEEYLVGEGNRISVYLPLTQIVNKDDSFVGYINEAVLASSFSEELGFIDKECLADYMNFNLTGGVFKTDDFKEVGKLKPSMKLTFWYEYMLRATFNNQKIYVIPKVGYYHMIDRDDSLSKGYADTIDEDEANFWFETAQKEYFFKQDRKKTY